MRCAAIAMVVLLAWIGGCAAEPMTHVSIVANGHKWSMELAMGDAAIQRGLMERTSLEPGTGMLFVFPKPTTRNFWMAWCVMPIDLVFLDARGRVVATWEMPVEPPIRDGESEQAYLQRMPPYSSRVPVRFAAEFPAGTIQDDGIKRGDLFDMDIAMLFEMEHRKSSGKSR